MTTFNEKELQQVREHIAELVKTKSETEVRTYIDEQFPRLPQVMQDELRISMFVSAIDEETRELNTIAKIQEEGLTASVELEAMKKEVEKEGGA